MNSPSFANPDGSLNLDELDTLIQEGDELITKYNLSEELKEDGAKIREMIRVIKDPTC